VNHDTGDNLCRLSDLGKLELPKSNDSNGGTRMKARPCIVLSSVTILLVAATSLFAASRFLDNGNQTITDTKTGLMWTKDAAPTVPASSGCAQNAVAREGADAFVACLNRSKYAGHSDWLVPSLQQMASLCNTNGDTAWLNEVLSQATSGTCNKADVDIGISLGKIGFTNVQSDKAYWTSTHWSVSGNGSAATSLSAVWAAVLAGNRGGVFVVGRPANFAVWPVRGAK
jgi:hypothetical protein